MFRYLVSGSDYGERKLLIWDAKQPVLSDPKQFPHMIFWSAGGLIKKILIRQGAPKPIFWLQQNQMDLITEDESLDIWAGEVDDNDMTAGVDFEGDEDDEDDDEYDESIGDNDTANDEEEKEEEGNSSKKKLGNNKAMVALEALIQDDICKIGSVRLSVIATSIGGGKDGEQIEAREYVPGGHLFISIQVIL